VTSVQAHLLRRGDPVVYVDPGPPERRLAAFVAQALMPHNDGVATAVHVPTLGRTIMYPPPGRLELPPKRRQSLIGGTACFECPFCFGQACPPGSTG